MLRMCKVTAAQLTQGNLLSRGNLTVCLSPQPKYSRKLDPSWHSIFNSLAQNAMSFFLTFQ